MGTDTRAHLEDTEGKTNLTLPVRGGWDFAFGAMAEFAKRPDPQPAQIF